MTFIRQELTISVRKHVSMATGDSGGGGCSAELTRCPPVPQVAFRFRDCLHGVRGRGARADRSFFN